MNTRKSLPTTDVSCTENDVNTLNLFSDRDRYCQFPARSGMKFSTFNSLGIQVQDLTSSDLLAVISEAVTHDAKYVVANHNMHSLYLWHHDAKMRAFHARADFTHLDGMALVALFRVFGHRLTRQHRTTYLDFLPLLAHEAVKQGWKIYYLGSRPGVTEKGAARLREQYLGLQFRARHGYFDTKGAENEAIISDIAEYGPNVLLVGMGMPRQEEWINENHDQISAQTIFCVGALMDYIAGEVPTCPRWLAGIGFEWLHRLLSEPERLWHRYLVEPWFILGQLGSAYFKVSFERASSAVEDGEE